MRKSDYILLYLTGNMLLLIALFAHATFHDSHTLSRLQDNRALVKKLGLTDLCLFTEASYTRHPSQTDMNTPFQDCPLCLDYFPSGSFLMPSEILKRSYGKID